MRGNQKETHRAYESWAESRNKYYVYGNVVPEPVEKPVKLPPRKVSRRARINRRRALSMSPGYVCFLLMSVVVAMSTCVHFVNMRSDLNKMSANVTVLQNELERDREENSTRYNNAVNSISMEEIRARAEELGMRYASVGQVIEYRSTSDEYVKQYGRIPEGGMLAKFMKD